MSTTTTVVVNPTNPVSEYYANYAFNTKLPVIECENYEDVTDVYHENVKTPVTNNGTNCTVKNVVKGLKITKKDLLSPIVVITPDPVDPTPDPVDPTPDPVDPTVPKITIIPEVVDKTKIYKLNPDLTEVQVEEILDQFELKLTSTTM
jgi:hypothetical protein